MTGYEIITAIYNGSYHKINVVGLKVSDDVYYITFDGYLRDMGRFDFILYLEKHKELKDGDVFLQCPPAGQTMYSTKSTTCTFYREDFQILDKFEDVALNHLKGLVRKFKIKKFLIEN